MSERFERKTERSSHRPISILVNFISLKPLSAGADDAASDGAASTVRNGTGDAARDGAASAARDGAGDAAAMSNYERKSTPKRDRFNRQEIVEKTSSFTTVFNNLFCAALCMCCRWNDIAQ